MDYHLLQANFRGTSFIALIRTFPGTQLTKEDLCELVCKHFKTTIPHSEITTQLSEKSDISTDKQFNAYEGTKIDLVTVLAE